MTFLAWRIDHLKVARGELHSKSEYAPKPKQETQKFWERMWKSRERSFIPIVFFLKKDANNLKHFWAASAHINFVPWVRMRNASVSKTELEIGCHPNEWNIGGMKIWTNKNFTSQFPNYATSVT